jgi:ABC-2 type transport system ATP-binding protein
VLFFRFDSNYFIACFQREKMDSFAIEINSLNKVFKTKTGLWKNRSKSTTAVENISFSVERGELFGLLGPNGAGKTTTVKMLTTLLLPTGGTARILGLDVVDQTAEVRKHIGFAFSGSRGLYNRLTASQNLKYFSELYSLNVDYSNKRIAMLLELVGLADRANDRVETYSSGMIQRLHLARALLHDPEVLFLDEPTVGIDPVGSRELRKTIKNLLSLGKTILLTTHYMAEAEELCHRIAIVKKGNIVALDTPDALKRRISGESVIEASVQSSQVHVLLDQLEILDKRTVVEHNAAIEPEKICIHTLEPGRVMELLSPYLNPQYIINLEARSQTLEDVYIAIIQGDQV